MALIGIIDIGSNSMRLSIIRRIDNGGYYVVDEHKSSPRLAGRLSETTGELAPEGVAELIEHLYEFLDLCHTYGVTETQAIGTAALRAAVNRAAVCEAVRTATGIEIDVISGREEAWLGYQAVAHTLDVDMAYLVDIGGGSTEITLVESGEWRDSFSLPFGAVTLSRELRDSAALVNNFRLPPQAERQLADLAFLDARPGAEVIGIGGTVRNLARLHQVERSYPLTLTHNYVMRPDEVEASLRRLADMPLARRRKVEGLSKDRADLIVPGLCILLAVLRRTRASRLRVSGRGLRDGAFYARVLRDQSVRPESIVEKSVKNVLHRFSTPEVHAAQVTGHALAIFEAIVRHGLLPGSLRSTQYTAAMLHRIGVQVSYYSFDRHTFYLIVNSQIYGLSHREIVIAALAASFKSRGGLLKLAAPYRMILTEDDLALAARLGVITRLGEALDRRHEGRVRTVRVDLTADEVILRLDLSRDARVEISAARGVDTHVQKIFGRRLQIAATGDPIQSEAE